MVNSSIRLWLSATENVTGRITHSFTNVSEQFDLGAGESREFIFQDDDWPWIREYWLAPEPVLICADAEVFITTMYQQLDGPKSSRHWRPQEHWTDFIVSHTAADTMELLDSNGEVYDTTAETSRIVATSYYDDNRVRVFATGPLNNTYFDNPRLSSDTVLNKGEVASFSSWAGDLSGTIVQSCKPISVNSGNVHAHRFFPDPDNAEFPPETGQATYDQVPAISTLGKRYLTIPVEDIDGETVYHVIAPFDNTRIRVNGVFHKTLNRSDTTVLFLDSPSLIEGNNEFYVAQYIPIQICDTRIRPCGPEFCALGPFDNLHTQKMAFHTFEELLITTGFPTDHYMNILTKTATLDQPFLLDGQPINLLFRQHPQLPQYSYAQVELQPGDHMLEAAGGFSAYNYGYGVSHAYMFNLTNDFIGDGGPILEDIELTLEDDAPICPGEFVNLNLKGQQQWLQHGRVEWDLGDGNRAEGLSVRHQYTTAGTYEVLALYDRGAGCFSDTLRTQIRVQAPLFVTEPEVISFGEVAGCENSADFTLRLFNRGNIAGEVLSLATQDAALSLVSPAPRFMVEAGEFVDVTVRFTPDAAGPINSQFYLRAEPCNVQMVIPVTGSAGEIDISVSPASLNFGSLRECDAPVIREVTIVNSGTSAFDIGELNVTAPFIITDMPQTPLAPGETTIITMQFDPAGQSGDYNDILTFVSDDGICRQDWAINLMAAVRTLDLDLPALLDFAVFYGCAVQDTTINLSVNNPSDEDVEIDLQLRGGGPRFEITPARFTLASGASQVLELRFTPNAAGTFDAELIVNTDFCDQTFTIAVRGEYRPLQLGGLRDLHFGSLAVNASRTRQLRLTNQGGASLRIARLAITPPGTDFRTTTTDPLLPATLDGGESIDIELEYQPAAAGEQSAELNIEVDAPCARSWTVKLSGDARNSARTVVQLPDVVAGIGETIDIPLTVNSAVDTDVTVPSGWAAVIRYNREIFDLRGIEDAANVTFVLRRDDAEEQYNIADISADFSGAIQRDQVLANLRGVTLMNIDTTSQLEILDFSWVGDDIQNESINGSLVLRDACINYAIALGGRPSFLITPNPAEDELNVRVFNLGGIVPSVTIVNAMGQTLLSQMIEGMEHGATINLDISSIPAGAYYVRFGAAGFSDSQVLIKAR